MGMNEKKLRGLGGKYILDENGNPKLEKDLLVWGKWLNTADRQVAITNIGKTIISTVFLGLDHCFIGNGKPILYETMVFGGKLNYKMERYCTKEEAIKGHNAIVKQVKEAL
jgi:hypothetical protein